MSLRGALNAKRSLVLVGLTISLVLFLATLWTDDSVEHALVSTQLIELKELDANLDRDVLRITSFLLAHYDSLAQTVQRLNELEAQMRDPQPRHLDRLVGPLNGYWEASHRKLEILERIKFQAALVRNGILYLPVAAEQVKGIDSDIYTSVTELLNQLYLLNLFYSDSQLDAIREKVEALAEVKLDNPNDQKNLENALFHMQANLRDLSSLGELKRQYLEIPTQTIFKQLHDHYEGHRVSRARTKRTTILLLSISVVALMIGLWYLIRSLQRAHQNVKRSWDHLHDAVENLSEAFALFDADNRLVLFNHRYVEYYPWLKDWLVKGVPMQTLKSVADKRIQYLGMEGGPLQHDDPLGQYLEKVDEHKWYLASNNPTAEGGMVCVRTDITESKSKEADLRKLGRALEQSPTSVIITSIDGTIEYVNPKFEEVSGYSAQEAIGQNPRILKSGDKTPEDYKKMWSALLSGKEWRGVFHNKRKDGSIYWESASISPLRDDEGKITHFIAVKEDVTAQKRAEEQLRMNATVFDTTSEGIMVTDADNIIKTVNPAFSQITGYEAEEVIGHTPHLLSSGRHTKTFYDQLWTSVSQSGYWSGEIWNRRKDGSVYPEWLSIAAIKNESGIIKEYVAVFSDISKHKQDEEKIRYQANFDALTGLPNRSLLTDRLTQAILSANREGWKLALLFIDLDQFKVVNDTFGHVMGDELLQMVSARIRNCVREVDTVARFGGDEFVVLMQDVNDLEAPALVASKVIAEVTGSFTLYQREIYIGASIGITVYPDDANTPDALLRNADMAMYQAKEQGRNNYQFFTPSMQRQTIERQQLEQDLRQAVQRGELELYYQPVIETKTNKVSSLEALLRWNHSKKGRIPPDQFIPLAEDCGLIGPIGEWVVAQACTQLSRWHQYGYDRLSVAINLSSRQRELGLETDFLKRVLADTGLKGESVTLEITERLLMRDTEESVKWLSRFKQLGVKLSVDDFGTGYSSLSYLKRFPVDMLKIDRSFVSDLPGDSDSASLVRTIIGMAKSLNLGLVAEGVEKEEQVAFLTDEGCELLQGFYYAKPMSVAELNIFLEKDSKVTAIY
jgi:diguanylate cyclase (GGDEF)-like protein/PAS domain S-box-containing protein